MKFTFKNLGPIKTAEMRLGDLTVVAGENNTGKSYLASALYGFLRLIEIRDPPILHMEKKTIKGIVEMLPTVSPRPVIEKISLADAEKGVRDTLRDFSKFYSQKGIGDTFSSPNGFPNFSFQCLPDKMEWRGEFAETTTWRELKEEAGETGTPPQMWKTMEIRRKGDYMVLSFKGARFPDAMSKSVALGCVWGRILAMMPRPFILSAERFGISLFYKELDFTKNRLVEMIQNLPEKGEGKYDIPSLMRTSSARYAQPVKDNIDYTRGLTDIQNGSGIIPRLKLFSGIESMMGGHYERGDYEIQFVGSRKKESAFRIPLHLASSSVRGMSDFYFYLKHTASPGQLLIIDEPETHLHPTNQVRLARLMARCVNNGLLVLITTHSDYIVKELNNLIMLSQKFPGKAKFLAKNKKHYDKGDYLKAESVRAYVCEKGKLTECKIDSRGMAMESFNNPILEIDRISRELDDSLPDNEE